MNDPHVERLVYSLATDGTVAFADPDPVELETDAFRLRLEDGELTVEMLEHHASPKSARRAVEPYLRAWSLLGRDGRIWFKYEDAQVIDRDPPEGTKVHLEAVSFGVSVDSAEVTVKTGSYPDPPSGFEVSPHVEDMLTVYGRYLDDGGTIGWMGYFCLTALRHRLGEGDSWRHELNVSRNVASTLSRLTARIGDHETGRKMGSGVEYRSHTGAEVQWIKRAVAALIRRLGEWEHDPDREWAEQLTMAHLPTLPD